MSLNAELLAHIQAAEAEYGHVSDWPKSVVQEARKLSNRDPDDVAERKDAEWLYRRGFTSRAVARKMHRSTDWASRRKPVIEEYIYTDDDLEYLKLYERDSVRQVAQRMERNQLWVKEMRRKL